MAHAPKKPAPKPHSIRALAKELDGVPGERVRRLRTAGIEHRKADTLTPEQLHKAREALGLPGRANRAEAGRSLTRDELIVRCLRPLLVKKKVGRNHTTPAENIWGHGVPDHQKGEARALAEELLASGLLEEKPSQGRQHFYLTTRGAALLAATEAALRAPRT
jgi:hypothetical protein